jgi:hypothetical protein
MTEQVIFSAANEACAAYGLTSALRHIQLAIQQKSV